MNPSEVIYKMKEGGLSSLAHIMIGKKHEYYVTIPRLEALEENAEIKILSMEVQNLSTTDVMGRAPSPNKKRLYNIRT